MKKLLHMIKHEKEEYIEEQHYVHESTEIASPPKRTVDGVKNVEARIAYQYPKGSFRFPLIPDEERERGEGKKGSFVHNKERGMRMEKVTVVPNYSVEKEEPIYQQKKIEKEMRRSRPFKPTIIPSPIYGFKDRPQNRDLESLVEFELDAFEKTRQSSTQKDHLFAQKKTDFVEPAQQARKEDVMAAEPKAGAIKELQIEREMEIAATVENSTLPQISEFEKVNVISEAVLSVKAISDQEIADEKLEPQIVTMRINDNGLQIENKKAEMIEVAEIIAVEEKDESLLKEAESLEVIVERVQFAENKELQEAVIAEGNIEVTGQSETEAPAPLAQEKEELQEAVIAEGNIEVTGQSETEAPAPLAQEKEELQETVIAEGNIEVIGQSETEAPAPLAQEKEELQEAVIAEGNIEVIGQGETEAPAPLAQEKEELQETEIAEGNIEVIGQGETEAPAPLAQEKEEEKERSHIPFNVIMLNQDRRKWEQRRKSSISKSQEHVKNSPASLHELERERKVHYEFPSFQLLTPPVIVEENDQWVEEQKEF